MKSTISNRDIIALSMVFSAIRVKFYMEPMRLGHAAPKYKDMRVRDFQKPLIAVQNLLSSREQKEIQIGDVKQAIDDTGFPLKDLVIPDSFAISDEAYFDLLARVLQEFQLTTAEAEKDPIIWGMLAASVSRAVSCPPELFNIAKKPDIFTIVYDECLSKYGRQYNRHLPQDLASLADKISQDNIETLRR